MARMNSGIILAGQTPNMLNTLAQSDAMAARKQEMGRRNRLDAVMQQHGPGILAGNQNALDAFARVDPTGAMNMQNQRSQNSRANERLRFEIARYAEGLSAEQAAKEAEEARRNAIMLSQVTDEASYDALAARLDPNLVGTFANKDQNVQMLMTSAELLEASKPAKPLSSAGKLKADHDAGLVTDQQFAVESSGSGMRFESDGEGGFTLEQGKGVTGGKAPSERQSTLHLFGGLMNETMPEINALEADPSFNPTSARSQAAGAGVAGNVVTSTEAQRYESLKRQWAEGVLRIQTGAAATQPEIERVMQTYFPVFGDSEETVRQKQIQRDIFARSLTEASNGNVQAPGGADQRQGLGSTPSPLPDLSNMTDEQLQAIIEGREP